MNEVIIEYDIENLSISFNTIKYRRTIKCKDMNSFLEEVKRTYIDLKDYFKNIKESE